MRRLLWPHLKPRLPAFAAALGLALLIAALSAAQPLLTRMVIDQGLIAHRFPRLVAACAGMLGVAALGFLLGGAHRAIYMRASGAALFSLRRAVYEHLLRVSPRRLAGIPVGDLVSRLDGDIAEVQRFGTDAASSFIGSVLSLAAAAAVMLKLSWRLTLLVAALLPLQLLVRHYARPRLQTSTRDLREAASVLSGFLIETLSGARHVQAAATEQYEAQRLENLGADYLKRALRQQWIGYATGSLSALLGHVATAAAFVLGGWYVLQGQLTVGTLVAFAAYLGRSAGSASSMTGLYSGYHRARVSLARVRQLLDLPQVRESPEAVALASDARGALRFESVTVAAAAGGRPVLDSVTLDIPAGTKAVLRGVSGAGKSTLADLLRRFVDPDTGRILLDGRPLGEYRLAELRRRIVVVEHSPILFGGTILENLRYGHDQVGEAEVLEAAHRSGVHEFVEALPAGYATRVGEGGAGLSTGQRQRIAIARAVLARPLIVVLDEATSGLDIDMARMMHRSLDAAFGDRTRLIITHHASDVEQWDLCWRLEAGRIRPALLVGT